MASIWAGLKSKIGEQMTVTGSLRSAWSGIRRTFWPGAPIFDGTRVHYDLARMLYRNDGQDANLAGFCKSIIDSEVEFVGLPRAASGD